MSTVAYYIPQPGPWRMPDPISVSDPIIAKRDDLQAAAAGNAEATTSFGKFKSSYKLQSDLFAMTAERYKGSNDQFFEFKVNSTAYGEALNRTMNVKL